MFKKTLRMFLHNKAIQSFMRINEEKIELGRIKPVKLKVLILILAMGILIGVNYAEAQKADSAPTTEISSNFGITKKA